MTIALSMLKQGVEFAEHFRSQPKSHDQFWTVTSTLCLKTLFDKLSKVPELIHSLQTFPTSPSQVLNLRMFKKLSLCCVFLWTCIHADSCSFCSLEPD